MGRAGRKDSARHRHVFVGSALLPEVPTGWASQQGQGWGAQPSCRGGLGGEETLRTTLSVEGEDNWED